MTSDETSDFRRRLVDARLAFGAGQGRLVSQTELAAILGVTPGAWSAWESGRNQPDLETVALLADALGVSDRWLAWGRGERYPPAAEGAPGMAQEPPDRYGDATARRKPKQGKKTG